MKAIAASRYRIGVDHKSLSRENLRRDAERVHGLEDLEGSVFRLSGPDIDRALLVRELPHIKGALWHASRLLNQQFADDLAECRSQGERWDPILAETASYLPAFLYPDEPDEHLLQRLALAASEFTTRLEDGWTLPTCVGEEIAVVLLLNYVKLVFQVAELEYYLDAESLLEEVLLPRMDVYGLYNDPPRFASDQYRLENWFDKSVGAGFIRASRDLGAGGGE